MCELLQHSFRALGITNKAHTWLASLLLALGFRLRLLYLDVLSAAEPQVHVPGAPVVPAGGPGPPPAVCLLRRPVHGAPHLVAAPLAPPVVISIVLHLGNHAVPNLRGTRTKGLSSYTELIPTRSRELLRVQWPTLFVNRSLSNHRDAVPLGRAHGI